MIRLMLLAACLLSVVVTRGTAAAAEAPPAAGADQFFKAYVEAFAAGDAKKLAAMWTADAEWTNGVTGEHSSGRDAVEADFAAFFADNPGARLTGDVERAKEVAPGVMCIEGVAVVSTPGGEPATSAFTAVLVSQQGAWRLASVRESAPATPDTPYLKLKELEFLVGDWRDDGGEAEVRTSFRWAAEGAFLVRTYSATRDDVATTGTQVIGWDPRQNRIRSWNFVSDGSFGEGLWSKSGDEWLGRQSQTLADGGVAAATQIIRQVDANTLEVQTIGREIDGEPQPSTPPVRVVRVADEDAATEATTAEGGQS